MSLFNNAKLILTPNGYKDGKLYTFKPFDGSKDFDVVRATKATRVNSNGLIEEVDNNIIRLDYTENSCPCILVEDQSTNILLRSDEFNNNYWLGVRIANVLADESTAPDGTLTADKIIANNVSGSHYITHSTISVNENDFVSGSVFVKANNEFFCHIEINERNNSSFVRSNRIIVNLQTGEFSQVGNVFSSNVQQLPNDWTRIQITTQIESNTNEARLHVGGAISLSSIIYVGDNQSGFFAWGAQLEQGTEVTSYIPTTTTTVTRNADIATVTPPAGTTQIIETFEDNSTNIITSIPSTYQLPVGRIKHIVML